MIDEKRTVCIEQMTKNIIYEKNKTYNYGLITLNRPEKRNAISKSMIDQLKLSIERAKSDEIKALVITGEGEKTFCAGGDLTYFHPELSTEEAFSRLYEMKEVLFDLLSFDVPTICLLNGSAFGGGCELATACDIRIAREGTYFGFVQSSLGIIPGWGGGELLYHKVNPNFAFQWLVEGTVLDTEQLHASGWLHDVVVDDSWHHIDRVLEKYLMNTIEQMSYLKLQYKQHLATLSFSATMNEEVRQCSELWGSTRHRSQVKQILNKE